MLLNEMDKLSFRVDADELNFDESSSEAEQYHSSVNMCERIVDTLRRYQRKVKDEKMKSMVDDIIKKFKSLYDDCLQ